MNEVYQGEIVWSGVGSISRSVFDWFRRQEIENPPPVLSKRDFVERYRRGEFGNASPTWNTVDDFLLIVQGHKGFIPSYEWPERFHLRNRNAGGVTYYNLYWSELIARWCEQEDKEDWYASAMAPHDRGTIQGEVMRTTQGLYLYYASAKKPMREALAEEGKEATGIIAVSLLREYLCPNSYEWLNVLLDRYPDHIVEFSSFEVEWGTLPGFNSVFWEVRKY